MLSKPGNLALLFGLARNLYTTQCTTTSPSRERPGSAKSPRPPCLQWRLVISTVVGCSVGGTVLTLETDGLVGEEVADARVTGGEDGETNDDTCTLTLVS